MEGCEYQQCLVTLGSICNFIFMLWNYNSELIAQLHSPLNRMFQSISRNCWGSISEDLHRSMAELYANSIDTNRMCTCISESHTIFIVPSKLPQYQELFQLYQKGTNYLRVNCLQNMLSHLFPTFNTYLSSRPTYVNYIEDLPAWENCTVHHSPLLSLIHPQHDLRVVAVYLQ